MHVGHKTLRDEPGILMLAQDDFDSVHKRRRRRFIRVAFRCSGISLGLVILSSLFLRAGLYALLVGSSFKVFLYLSLAIVAAISIPMLFLVAYIANREAAHTVLRNRG